ncbi:hypothetical protein GGX14DRAFT_558309 [Mycena pura]|uniref:Uncharacterized protein n=1 Tax=Mycena pura TaxID=153505 RepID=A0AAD6VTD2_9AGAR|nr:hypothetical protein GGX14DRAFT_558309 [Mycena pura]
MRNRGVPPPLRDGAFLLMARDASSARRRAPSSSARRRLLLMARGASSARRRFLLMARGASFSARWRPHPLRLSPRYGALIQSHPLCATAPSPRGAQHLPSARRRSSS